MKKKLIPVVLVILALFAFYKFDLNSYLTLIAIQQNRDHFAQVYAQNPLTTSLLFFALYVAVTAVSFPGAALLTLLAGSLFGLAQGMLLVSFASSIGASLAFLASRYVLRDFVTQKFAKSLTVMNEGIQKNGATYLLSLRLIPAVPFFLVNLGLGLTKMRLPTFYIVSQLGMLPGTFAYVNAGTQLASIEKTSDILSPALLGSFLLLGLLPLFFQWIQCAWKKRKLYSRFQKPKKFDYNIVTVGAGAAGLVTSYIGAAAKAKVALIEKHKMGGDCLNTGCIPSKTLIRTAKFVSDAKNAQSLGIEKVDIQFQLKDVMERVRRVIRKIEPHDSVERYTKLGVECFTGNATIQSPWEVVVNGQTLTAKNIVLATGARPFVPEMKGLTDCQPRTSDNIWQLETLPKRLLVLGGGAIGLELAQAFHRLGSQVTVVERAERILPREDHEVYEWISEKFNSEGIQVLESVHIEYFTSEDGQKKLHYRQGSQAQTNLAFDEVLVALGRKANVENFGLEALGLELTEQKAIKVNAQMQTNFPNIFACGDVTGLFQFTHAAAHQAWFTSMNALLRPFYSFRADHSIMPWCIYTDPEIARVGLNEKEAMKQNIEYDVTFYNSEKLDRALTEESGYGFVKILTAKDSDKILGVTLVGLHAGECLAEFVLAMKHGLGLNKILSTIHTYPTLTEANKFAAGLWRTQRISERLLKLSKLLNKWQRS